ncbi:hypothetical protein MNV49_006602 [Pseudohyphozyma bogoriensis]|nr:hypothetical protein MNV49_006602 [Pseudohyphozyma bogoriensis]
MTTKRTLLTVYPSGQSYTTASLRAAFSELLPDWQIATSRDEFAAGTTPDCQWSDYDEIDWDEGMSPAHKRLVNSYVIRKSLIRKNHLAHTTSLYLSKNPDSPLRHSSLKTLHFTLSYPDELDELLQDDLYELQESFDAAEESGEEGKWWILKAALADKGQGIRLFNSREMLEEILEEFDIESDDEEEEEEGSEDEDRTGVDAYGGGTRVSLSTMREWVIMEYVSHPLLLSPTTSPIVPRKFHLRVYVVAVGGLKVYVHHPYLALFAPTQYFPPSTSDSSTIDLSSHLTNTCLQTSVEGTMDIAVRTLQGMKEEEIQSGPFKGEKLGEERVNVIEGKVQESVREIFKAGISAGSGFQVLPNCFEIFGFDFLVDENLAVSLLEINACPDFTQTGSELQGVVDSLFRETVRVAVAPYFDEEVHRKTGAEEVTEGLEGLKVEGGTRGLVQVLDMQSDRRPPLDDLIVAAGPARSSAIYDLRLLEPLQVGIYNAQVWTLFPFPEGLARPEWDQWDWYSAERRRQQEDLAELDASLEQTDALVCSAFKAIRRVHNLGLCTLGFALGADNLHVTTTTTPELHPQAIFFGFPDIESDEDHYKGLIQCFEMDLVKYCPHERWSWRHRDEHAMIMCFKRLFIDEFAHESEIWDEWVDMEDEMQSLGLWDQEAAPPEVDPSWDLEN